MHPEQWYGTGLSGKGWGGMGLDEWRDGGMNGGMGRRMDEWMRGWVASG